jgi:putative transposase
MKKFKFTKSHIVKIQGEQVQGKKLTDIWRIHGIRQPTFYGWKSNMAEWMSISSNGLKSLNRNCHSTKELLLRKH